MSYHARSYSRSRSRSPGTPMRRDPPSRCSLLIRNLHKDTRDSDLRYFAEKYGPVRDVYLPRDYYTGESRGIGFVEFTNPRDAEEAKHQMDKVVLLGREISAVFAMQGRKRPDDYRRGRGGGGGRGYSRYRGGSSPPRRRYTSRSPPRRYHGGGGGGSYGGGGYGGGYGSARGDRGYGGDRRDRGYGGDRGYYGDHEDYGRHQHAPRRRYDSRSPPSRKSRTKSPSPGPRRDSQDSSPGRRRASRLPPASPDGRAQSDSPSPRKYSRSPSRSGLDNPNESPDGRSPAED